MQLENNKILITGGGSGIGLGMAKRFMEEGNTVIICGRRESLLSDVARQMPGILTKACDLSNQEGRQELYLWVSQNHPDLNILVNNAGIQNWMDVTDDAFYKKAEAEVAVNIMAPIHLTNLFLQLPSLKTIMNVTSGLAFVPLAKVPVYCATKAFMRSFTLSLRHQLKDSGVEVIEVIPPALNTDLGGKGIHDAYPPVSDFIASIFQQLKEGKNEVSFGTSTDRVTENNSSISNYFNRMNGN